MGGYLRVAGVASVSNPGNGKSSTATCTGGRVVLGGGYLISGADADQISISQNLATSDTVWSVAAQEIQNNVTTAWSVQAYAICGSATP
jgi:hypothetical protein